MDEKLNEYRKDLIQTVQKLNENYDKLIITLAGGSLGLSLAFIKNIVGNTQIQSPLFLISAWILFILSLTSVLGALLFGIAAHEKAITQVDSEKIYKEEPGGIYSKITTILHYLGTVFLVVGFIFIVSFGYSNMEKGEIINVQKARNTKAITTEPQKTKTFSNSNKKR